MSRDELIEELGNLVKKHSNSGISHKLSYTMKRWELELVADFIIADRSRIVEPLVKFQNNGGSIWPAVEETLKLSGIKL